MSMALIPTLKTIVAQEAIRNTLEEIDKPLMAQITHCIATYPNDAGYLTKPFAHEPSWLTMEPYRDFTFEYDHAKFTFIQLCNMFEMMFDASTAYEFTGALTRQVKIIVTKALLGESADA